MVRGHATNHFWDFHYTALQSLSITTASSMLLIVKHATHTKIVICQSVQLPMSLFVTASVHATTHRLHGRALGTWKSVLWSLYGRQSKQSSDRGQLSLERNCPLVQRLPRSKTFVARFLSSVRTTEDWLESQYMEL